MDRRKDKHKYQVTKGDPTMLLNLKEILGRLHVIYASSKYDGGCSNQQIKVDRADFLTLIGYVHGLIDAYEDIDEDEEEDCVKVVIAKKLGECSIDDVEITEPEGMPKEGIEKSIKILERTLKGEIDITECRVKGVGR